MKRKSDTSSTNTSATNASQQEQIDNLLETEELEALAGNIKFCRALYESDNGKEKVIKLLNTALSEPKDEKFKVSRPRNVREQFVKTLCIEANLAIDVNRLDIHDPKIVQEIWKHNPNRKDIGDMEHANKRIYRKDPSLMANPDLPPQASVNRTKKPANLRLTPDFLESVDSHADVLSMSRTDFITTALEEKIARMNAKPK
ncbi:MAG: hypothetical protein K6L75_08520 [Cellvibrionaceae bacterium]